MIVFGEELRERERDKLYELSYKVSRPVHCDEIDRYVIHVNISTLSETINGILLDRISFLRPCDFTRRYLIRRVKSVC